MHQTRRLQIVSIIALTALLALSCMGNDEGGESGNGNGAESEEETEIRFVLQNETDVPLLIQQAVLPAPSWLTVTHDGEEIRIMWDCGMPCPCPSDEDEVQQCTNCVMLPAFVAEIAPGDEERLDWDGTKLVINDDMHSCYDEIAMDATEMEAEFCYGFEAHKVDGGEVIKDPICETVTFDLGDDDEVVLTVTEGPEEVPEYEEIDFVLENDTDQFVYIQMSDGAISPEPAYLSVLQDEEQLNVQFDCGLPCPCDEDEACMVCEAPMAWVKTIEPGGEERFNWDGLYLDIIDVDDGGMTCHEESRLEDALLSAEFCYGFAIEAIGPEEELVEDPECQTLDLHFGFDEEAVITVAATEN